MYYGNYISVQLLFLKTILNVQAENKDEYSNNICINSWKFINSTAHYSKREMLMVYCVPDTILGAENTEMSITKSMPWWRRHSNDPTLHVLADIFDFNFGGTPEGKCFWGWVKSSFGGWVKNSLTSLFSHKKCYLFFSVLLPICWFLVPSTSIPASRKVAPTDSGSKLLWS